MAAAIAAGLALTPGAFAGSSPTAYVDQDTGVDGACTTATNPCDTIARGLSEVESGGTVYVDDSPSSYPGGLSIGAGKSLVAQNFEGTDNGATVIESNAAATFALTVDSTGAAEINGFTFRGPDRVVRVSGPATIRSNTFDTPGGTNNGDLNIDGGGTSVLVEDNTFTDSDTVAIFDTGIKIAAGMSPTIRDNTLFGYYLGIDVRGADADPLIEGNTITRTHGAGSNAIFITSGAHPSITNNTLDAVVQGGVGINISPAFMGQAPGGADLERNTISGFVVGINAQELDAGELTLDGDLIHGNSQTGLSVTDLDGVPQSGGAMVAGATFADHGFYDILLRNADLVLDSSIVEDPIEVPTNESAECTISFSRGPTTTGTDSCELFQTSAAPGFVDATSGDYHLAAGSAMIEAGNPAPAPAGALDIDEGPREVDADGDCEARRDIGADEFGPGPVVDCVAPDTTITSGPRGRVKTRGRSATLRFRFTSSEGGDEFRCALDGAAMAPCASPRAVRVRARPRPAPHRFSVVAVDATGNVDSTPAVRRFQIVRKRSQR